MEYEEGISDYLGIRSQLVIAAYQQRFGKGGFPGVRRIAQDSSIAFVKTLKTKWIRVIIWKTPQKIDNKTHKVRNGFGKNAYMTRNAEEYCNP
jgi:hypothetical protein